MRFVFSRSRLPEIAIAGKPAKFRIGESLFLENSFSFSRHARVSKMECSCRLYFQLIPVTRLTATHQNTNIFYH
jgi:hypothetical protein